MLHQKNYTKDNKKLSKQSKAKIDSTRNKSKWSSFSFGNLKKEIMETLFKEQPIIKQKKISEKDYINAYIGKNHSWIKEKYSIPAALFGPFYLIYRKLYLQALILILIYMITYIYIPESIGIITRLLSNILLGFIMNTYYSKEVLKRIDSIKKENDNATKIEILDLCKKQGGTLSLKILFLLFIIYIIIISLATKENHSAKQQKEQMTNYDITYKIPKTLTINANHTNYQHFIDENKKGKCFITISGEATKQTEEEYYKNNKDIYSDYTQIRLMEEEINGIAWYHVLLEKNTYTKELYFKKHKEIMYSMIFDASGKEACLNDKTFILKSIELRKNN